MTMAALVLASGLSTRFGPDDKLMENLKGQALLAYCLDAAIEAEFEAYFIVTPENDPRARLAKSRGFTVIDNPHASDGMGNTIALGARHILAQGYDSVCILLGDMPFISGDYLKSLKSSARGFDAFFSHSQNRNHPPATFGVSALNRLTLLSGDKGASAIDFSGLKTSALDLPGDMAKDFDLASDFT